MNDHLEKKEQESASASAIEIQIQEDGFAAAMFVPEGAADFPSAKQVHLAIEKAGVSYGVDDGAVEKLLHHQIRGKSVVFAKGKRPKTGGNSRLLWHDNSAAGTSPRDVTAELANPSQELYLFMRVEKGQPILSKEAAGEGTAGVNVFGESMSAHGIDVPIPQGEGTELSKDGSTLLASRAGIASISGETVSVVEVNHIKGSVDAGTGNIKHDGIVHIEKDVRAGFRVEAIGDVYIGGNIEGAEVYSRGGSVIVRNGIMGQGRARILAGRNVVAGFIQDATVGAKLNVEAERYIINSTVTAGNNILALTNEGIVRGGTLFAEKRIEVCTAGTESQVETILKVGYTPPLNLSRIRYQLRTDQMRNRRELEYVQKRITFLKLLKERLGELDGDKEGQLAELEKKEGLLLSKHREQSVREVELGGEGETPEEEKIEAETIRIHGAIHPGVSVAIGDAGMDMDKERSNVIFFRAGERLSFRPLHQAVEK
ncbi:MAG: DUF342 domain-containing protein, partial [Fidelibacterota bacterium]